MKDPVFFQPSRPLTVGEISILTGAELRTHDFSSRQITGLASLDTGIAGSLVFVEGKRNLAALGSLNAAAVLCSEDAARYVRDDVAVLISAKPQQDFAAIGRLLFPDAVRPAPLTGETGISPAAHVDKSAVLEDGVIVEAGAVIGPDVVIGSGSVIAPNAVIGKSSRIGRESYIGPTSVVQNALIGNRVIVHSGVRIGQDGFGFVAGRFGAEKMPQLGHVIIQDDVEIGANTTVDRGALSDTIIGEGTKIDNLVQVAHNVRIGRSCLIAGLCGISGSVTLGDGVMLGGNVGLADHLTIGSGAAIAARAGVMNDIPAGQKWAGAPARPIKEFFREIAAIRKLTKDKTEKRSNDD